MACFRGTHGVLKIYSNAEKTGTDGAWETANEADAAKIAEIQSYSIDETADTFECTAFGDEYRKFDFSFKSWEASVEANWDQRDGTVNAYETDLSGQDFFVAGEYAYVEFFPMGEDTGAAGGYAVWSGKALITGVSINASFDSVIAMSITLQGTETLTKTWTA